MTDNIRKVSILLADDLSLDRDELKAAFEANSAHQLEVHFVDYGSTLHRGQKATVWTEEFPIEASKELHDIHVRLISEALAEFDILDNECTIERGLPYSIEPE